MRRANASRQPFQDIQIGFSVFCPIRMCFRSFLGHFALFADIFAPFPDIIQQCPQLPDHPRRSVLLAAIPCRVSKENRPAHRLGWTGRFRRERWSAVPNSHRALGGRLLERGVLEQKRSR